MVDVLKMSNIQFIQISLSNVKYDFFLEKMSCLKNIVLTLIFLLESNISSLL